MQIEVLLNNFKKQAFRLELLDIYNVEGEWEVFQQFSEGKHVDYPGNQEFCDEIKNHVNQGKSVVRVHVVPEVLTDYLNFEIKIGYLPQIDAGAKIFILERTKFDKLFLFPNPINDFWMFDNQKVLEFIYDQEGHFLKENLIEEQNRRDQYLTLKEKVLTVATPLTDWLKNNPEKLT